MNKMKRVDSSITANINIERYILALNKLAFRFVHIHNVKQTTIHRIDHYLTQGGFTLVYGEYVAPRMEQVEESLGAYLKQCNDKNMRAFIAETAQRCELIGEAYRGLKRAQEPCYSQGEKIGGATMRVSGYRYQILKCSSAEVSEGVLEIFPSFVELFNRLCVNYGCGAPLVDPLGRDFGGRDGAKIEVSTTAQLPTELDSTPIAMLTLGQLKEALQPHYSATTPEPQKATEEGKRYVYGLRGIRELFGVCHATAQRYKNTFLRPAVRQNGRKMIVDVDMAMELFNQREV